MVWRASIETASGFVAAGAAGMCLAGSAVVGRLSVWVDTPAILGRESCGCWSCAVRSSATGFRFVLTRGFWVVMRLDSGAFFSNLSFANTLALLTGFSMRCTAGQHSFLDSPHAFFPYAIWLFA